MRGHVGSVSAFVREAVDEKIGRSTGYEYSIRSLEDELVSLQAAVAQKLQELDAQKKQQESLVQEQAIVRVNDILGRALTKIDYESAEDAAKDLEEARGSIPVEEWNSLVKRKWEEIHSES